MIEPLPEHRLNKHQKLTWLGIAVTGIAGDICLSRGSLWAGFTLMGLCLACLVYGLIASERQFRKNMAQIDRHVESLKKELGIE